MRITRKDIRYILLDEDEDALNEVRFAIVNSILKDIAQTRVSISLDKPGVIRVNRPWDLGEENAHDKNLLQFNLVDLFNSEDYFFEDDTDTGCERYRQSWLKILEQCKQIILEAPKNK